MKRLLLGCALAGAGLAQVEGDYHFIEMQVRAERGGRLAVRSGGGSIRFDGRGGYQVKASLGTNKEAARAVERAGKYAADGPNRIRMASPAEPDAAWRLWVGEDGAVLVGSTDSGARTYDLVVAARAAQAGGAAPPFEGRWAGGYLGMGGGDPRRLTTSYVEMSPDGAGKIAAITAIGHVTGIDDVNRREERKDLAYQAAGAGVVRLEAAGFDDTMLSGEKVVMVSGDGEVALGYGAGAGQREVMVLLKKPAEQAASLLQGLYWIGELGAESPYRFAPEQTEFVAASGQLLSGGDGQARIVERVKMGDGAMELRTRNAYRIGTDGASAFGPRLTQGVVNFAISENGRRMVGAEAGADGELTLQHGILFGVRAPGGSGLMPRGAPAAMHADLTPVSGSRPARPGETIVLLVVGMGQDAKVSIGDKACEVKPAGCLAGVVEACLVQVKVPAEAPAGAAVPVAIESGGVLNDALDIAVARP